jgi:hypothetical protein
MNPYHDEVGDPNAENGHARSMTRGQSDMYVSTNQTTNVVYNIHFYLQINWIIT